MKKLFSFLVFQLIVVFSLHAQAVSDYTYKLDNGINIRMDHCWNQVWVQQSYSPLQKSDQAPFAINTRTLGDLITSSSYKLLAAGKEVKMQGVAPGTYDLRLSFKLSATPGTLTFLVKNIIIKPDTKTKLDVTLYDYQVNISEAKSAQSGLASFATVVNKCKSHSAQDTYTALPAFYLKENHEKAVAVEGAAGKTTGKIKPGTYDLLMNVSIADQKQKIWLENFTMKPDIQYTISTNLNAGGIAYAGVEKNVKSLLMYPAGTAGTQTGNPGPVKSVEAITYENVRLANCCSPGTYDVLINMKNGSKYEWRKNVAITTGVKTEIK